MIDNQTLHVIVAIADERDRQLKVEGIPRSHDDVYSDGELAQAAACYALFTSGRTASARTLWPWRSEWFKPKDNRRDLVRAAALIVAEIERLNRIEDAARAPQHEQQVLSGCAVRAAMQINKANIATRDLKQGEVVTTRDVLARDLGGKQVKSDPRNDALGLMQKQFMAAIDFACEQDGRDSPCGQFLQQWRQGDVSEWPEFKGPVPW